MWGGYGPERLSDAVTALGLVLGGWPAEWLWQMWC
jgi:hypothetical protein